jgi:hypothetical protein
MSTSPQPVSATSQIKLDGAQIRLSPWGAALGVQTDSVVTISKPDYEHAEEVLKHVDNLFIHAQSKSGIFARPRIQMYENERTSASRIIDTWRCDGKGARAHLSIAPPRYSSKVEPELYKKKELNDLVDLLEDIQRMSIEP